MRRYCNNAHLNDYSAGCTGTLSLKKITILDHSHIIRCVDEFLDHNRVGHFAQ